MSGAARSAVARGLLALGIAGSELTAEAQPKQPGAPTVDSGKPAPAPAAVSDNAELARVISLYQAGKYGDCARALTDLLSPSSKRPLTQAPVIEKARIYQAACWIGAGKPELADAPLRDAIRMNPQMSPPDSLMFPGPLVERFIQVRETLIDELRALEAERVRKARELAVAAERAAQAEQLRVRRLELTAARETIVDKNSRWIALAPFGVGQFQNRQPGLGWFFLSSELACVGVALTSTVVISRMSLNASRAGALESPAEVDARLQAWHDALVISSYGFIALATAGIAQAQLAFVPEFRETRTRELPPYLKRPKTSPISVHPDITSRQGGLSFGVTGKF